MKELQKAQDKPHPEVPGHMRGRVTGAMLHQQRLAKIAGRQRGADQDRRRLIEEIAEIEGTAP